MSVFEGYGRELVVEFAAVADADDGYFPRWVVDFVADAIVADADAPEVRFAFNFEASRGARV